MKGQLNLTGAAPAIPQQAKMAEGPKIQAPKAVPANPDLK